MCNDKFKGPRERILMKNIAYAGTLVALLGIDMDVIAQLLTEQFAGKERLRASNQLALRLGHDYALEHFDYPLACRVETMDATRGTILIDGNTAAALGCVYAGATVAAWYPITPSTSLMDAFTKYCAKFRRDPETGREQLSRAAGRGRARRDRDGAGRVMGGGTRVHLDVRPWHLVDAAN